MSEKILTISVAAYNVEGYIKRALDSCLIDDMDMLDVIVIDDGATDSSANIAEEYAQAYPDVFRVMRKDNGGYGTTVNLSLSKARGEFFKLLDGDDWFNKYDLSRLLHVLKKTPADLVVFDRRDVVGEVEQDIVRRKQGTYGTIIPTSSCREVFGHWNIATRTRKLIEIDYELPSHLLYTDQLHVLKSIIAANQIEFVDIAPYCYQLGRDGQSVSKESRISHLGDLEIVSKRGCDLSSSYLIAAGMQNWCLTRRLAAYHANLMKTYLLLPPSGKNRNRAMENDMFLRENFPTVAEEAANISKRLRVMRMLGYMGYWPLACKGVKNWA